MEELKRLRSSRRGYRSHLSKTLTSVAEILEGDPTSPLSELDAVLLANTLEQLQRKKEVLCDLNKKIAACITDEGELESEIYEAEEQETSLLDKIAKVKFFLRPRHPPVDVSPVQSSSNPRTKATQSETQLHSELPSESAIDASHVSNGSTQQSLTVPQVDAPHQYISTEASHHVTPLIPNPISIHAPVPVNNTSAITSPTT